MIINHSTVDYYHGADPCSTLHIGGIITHFYCFFRILKFWGGYIQVLPIFQVLTILKIWGFIQVLMIIYLINWKLLLENIKSIDCVHNENVYKLQFLNSWLCIIIEILEIKTKHDWT